MHQQNTDKTFYRSVKYIHRVVNVETTHEMYKYLWFDQAMAETISDVFVKRYIHAMKYLLSNKHEGLSKDLLKTSYFILTQQRLSDKKTNHILTAYYSNHEHSAHMNASVIYHIIHKITIKKQLLYAYLLLNYVLIAAGYSITVVYPSDRMAFEAATKQSKTDWLPIYAWIINNELRTRIADKTAHHLDAELTKEQIIKVVITYKTVLIRRYKIKSMYLYGSVITQQRHALSDVDFLIAMDESVIESYDIYQLVSTCKSMLMKRLKMKVDLIDISKAVKHFGTQGMQKTIKIF